MLATYIDVLEVDPASLDPYSSARSNPRPLSHGAVMADIYANRTLLLHTSEANPACRHSFRRPTKIFRRDHETCHRHYAVRHASLDVVRE